MNEMTTATELRQITQRKNELRADYDAEILDLIDIITKAYLCGGEIGRVDQRPGAFGLPGRSFASSQRGTGRDMGDRAGQVTPRTGPDDTGHWRRDSGPYCRRGP